MALKYRGLVPQGTERADPAELARTPDQANAVYAAFREASGKKPAVQLAGPLGAKPRPSGSTTNAGSESFMLPRA